MKHSYTVVDMPVIQKKLVRGLQMNKLIFLGLIIPVLMLLVPNVYASGIRYDSADGSTEEEVDCHINGYDSGFAGKYDSDRARECIEHDGNYNKLWAYGCEDSLRTEEECGELINNPVEIEDFEALKSENDRTCYDAGQEDGKANKPFNKDKDSGCYEFNDIGGGYEGGYQFGCERHSTESTCELMYEEKQYYCPNHPDIAGCVDFLHNATNKVQGQTSADIACTYVNVTCQHESNPEKYCLNYNDPVFCNTIGDLCDEDGFVKPEYPYCERFTDQ